MSKKCKKSTKRTKAVTVLLLTAIIVTAIGVTALAANDWNFQKKYNQTDVPVGASYISYTVNDYSSTRPGIEGKTVSLEEMELATKQWFEYVDYQYYSTEEDNDYIYKIYNPVDYSQSSVMAIRDYNPNELSSVGTVLESYWRDMAVMFANIAAANTSVILSGGISSGTAGAIGQELVAVRATALVTSSKDILKEAPYYASPEFMGISGTEWNGISNSGFYNADSLTISMGASETINIAKTNSTDSTFTVGATSSVGVSGGGILFAQVSGSISASASSALKYGVNYQQGQSVNNSVTVSRTFSCRKDAEVEDVPWKLVEYVVRVPYKVEIVSKEDGESIIATSYITNDLLKGVCRVFANGYIEHWNTGKLVTYADFFEGFLTATEVISKAKTTMGGND